MTPSRNPRYSGAEPNSKPASSYSEARSNARWWLILHPRRLALNSSFVIRSKPFQVRFADEVLRLDSDVEEAVWFSGRDRSDLTWQD
jgi:hypothetical protein